MFRENMRLKDRVRILEDKALSVYLNKNSDIATLKDRLDQLEGHLYFKKGYTTTVQHDHCGTLHKVMPSRSIINDIDKKLDALMDYLKLEYVDKVETNVIRRKK